MRSFLPTALCLFVSVAAAGAAEDVPTLAKQNRWVTSVAFINNGSQLVTGGGESLLYRAGDVKIWDAKSGAQAASLEGQPTIVWSLAASPDGKTLITSGYDGKSIPMRSEPLAGQKAARWRRTAPIARSSYGAPKAKKKPRSKGTRTG